MATVILTDAEIEYMPYQYLIDHIYRVVGERYMFDFTQASTADYNAKNTFYMSGPFDYIYDYPYDPMLCLFADKQQTFAKLAYGDIAVFQSVLNYVKATIDELATQYLHADFEDVEVVLAYQENFSEYMWGDFETCCAYLGEQPLTGASSMMGYVVEPVYKTGDIITTSDMLLIYQQYLRVLNLFRKRIIFNTRATTPYAYNEPESAYLYGSVDIVRRQYYLDSSGVLGYDIYTEYLNEPYLNNIRIRNVIGYDEVTSAYGFGGQYLAQYGSLDRVGYTHALTPTMHIIAEQQFYYVGAGGESFGGVPLDDFDGYIKSTTVEPLTTVEASGTYSTSVMFDGSPTATGFDYYIYGIVCVSDFYTPNGFTYQN